jgi:alkylhydroperoxidase family enzyme
VGSHAAVAAHGFSSETIAAVFSDWRTAPIPERLRLTLGLLEKLTLRPEQVGPEDVKPLLAAGISPDAIREALHVLFLFSALNRWSDSLDFERPLGDDYQPSGKFLFEKGYLSGVLPG